MEGVNVITAEPQVQITFTADEVRALHAAILGQGELAGAWYKIRAAERAVAVETAPRAYPRF